MNTKEKGQIGENIACTFLVKRGYTIMERNYLRKWGEIDIVALDGNTLVYVEVKTRSSYRFGRPEESVTPKKINFLKRAAKFYRNNRKNRLKLPELERIDVVAIDLTLDQPSLKLIKNASFWYMDFHLPKQQEILFQVNEDLYGVREQILYYYLQNIL